MYIISKLYFPFFVFWMCPSNWKPGCSEMGWILYPIKLQATHWPTALVHLLPSTFRFYCRNLNGIPGNHDDAYWHWSFHLLLRIFIKAVRIDWLSYMPTKGEMENTNKRIKKNWVGGRGFLSFLSYHCQLHNKTKLPTFSLISTAAGPHLLLPAILSADITLWKDICGERRAHGEMHYWTVSVAKIRNSRMWLQHKCRAGSLQIERSSITDTMDRQGVIIHHKSWCHFLLIVQRMYWWDFIMSETTGVGGGGVRWRIVLSCSMNSQPKRVPPLQHLSCI